LSQTRQRGCESLAEKLWLTLTAFFFTFLEDYEMKRLLVLGCGVLALAIVSPLTLSAASITWTDTGSTITDETIVSLNGTLVNAGSWTNSGTNETVTVGTENITFLAMGAGGNANITSTGAGTHSDAASYGGGGSATWQAVMDSFNYDGADPKVLTLNNLTAGKDYQIQLFASDARGGGIGDRTLQFSDNATQASGNLTSVFNGFTPTSVIGTFTAGDTTQIVYAHGIAQSQNWVNGYVLRDVTVVPEPTSIFLIVSMSIMGVGVFRRRRIRA